MTKRLFFILSILLCASWVQAGEKEWVDSVMSTLSLRDKVAQLFITHHITPDDAKGRAGVRHQVADNKVGGLLFGKADIADYAGLIDYAQSLAEVPLMITADAEWGLSMRLGDAVRFPKNLALGATSDLALIEEYGRWLAQECRALGISISFAPVMDVNSNPDNPVIGMRSFGEDKQRVADLGAALARGLKSGGVMAVAKHFPGHGDTNTDSHHALPLINKDLNTLEKNELVPFRRAIKDGIDGVMVAHLNIPPLDNSGLPSSLSSAIVTDLLKQRLGFKNLVFTDGLEMQGAQLKDGSSNAVAAFLAGSDMLLCPTNADKDIPAMVEAVESGRISQDRLDESLRKVLTYKYRLGVDKLRPMSAKEAKKFLTSTDAQALNDRLSAACITILRDDNNLLPISANHHAVVKAIGAEHDNDFVTTARRLNAERLQPADDANTLVVVGVFNNKTESVKQLSSLKKQYGQRLIPVFLTNPYQVKGYASVIKDLPTVVLAGENTPALQKAAANVVFGAAPVCGRTSVSVEGVCKAGEGVSRAQTILGRSFPDARMKETIDSLVEKGLETKAFTGCQVMVLKDGKIVYENNAGYTDTDKRHKVTANTLFDLASVSKCVGTLAAAMAAYDSGLLDLDAEIGKYLPALADDPKGRLKVKELMFHETGMPASLNVYPVLLDTATYTGKIFTKKKGGVYTVECPEGQWGNADARLRTDIVSTKCDATFRHPVAKGLYVSDAGLDTIRACIYAIQPSGKKSYKYSCLNFILLKDVVESVTGVPMQQWMDEEVHSLLNNDRVLYRPLDKYDISEVAATEIDNMLRHQKVHGYVHDETAAFSGGIQGNAGLFSNATNIARWTQMLLNGGDYGGIRLLESATADKFLTTHSPGGKRGLGFDLHGKFVGHTGFTGTCFWLDPKRNLAVIILTNRINPWRGNKAFKALNFRNAILDAADAAY
ncbi:MAG: serine hydrolase [Muribaculaceae bacterium]|nr:serine hydrolase [Muribaculaceae bacterium]